MRTREEHVQSIKDRTFNHLQDSVRELREQLRKEPVNIQADTATDSKPRS